MAAKLLLPPPLAPMAGADLNIDTDMDFDTVAGASKARGSRADALAKIRTRFVLFFQ